MLYWPGLSDSARATEKISSTLLMIPYSDAHPLIFVTAVALLQDH